ncbi:MAG: RNA 2',3'-cyclic phosphodiesterase [Pseudomonadota bacterium]
MPRLFAALTLPDDARLRLSMLRGPLQQAKWVEADLLHLTLRFAGDLDRRQAREWYAALADVSADPFALEISGTGAFGGDRPRSVWAGIKRSRPLEALQAAIETASRRAGLAPEPRNFHPHVTLARMRRGNAHDIATFLHDTAAFALPPIAIDSFCVLASRDRRGGGPYVEDARFMFQAWDEADDALDEDDDDPTRDPYEETPPWLTR